MPPLSPSSKSTNAQMGRLPPSALAKAPGAARVLTAGDLGAIEKNALETGEPVPCGASPSGRAGAGLPRSHGCRAGPRTRPSPVGGWPGRECSFCRAPHRQKSSRAPSGLCAGTKGSQLGCVSEFRHREERSPGTGGCSVHRLPKGRAAPCPLPGDRPPSSRDGWGRNEAPGVAAPARLRRRPLPWGTVPNTVTLVQTNENPWTTCHHDATEPVRGNNKQTHRPVSLGARSNSR